MSTVSTDDAGRFFLQAFAQELEKKLQADVLSLVGPLFPGIDTTVRNATESFLDAERRAKLAVVLSTGGGVVETVERIVVTLRHHWPEVAFIVPDRAMSAGTVLALSGDELMMDYFSVLGPIDPQVPRNDRLVPALSYLTQFERLMKKFQEGTATTGDLTLLDKLDLAELHQFEEARELSVSLLENWLATYKFKDWATTETRKQCVTVDDRRRRAEEIARQLADHQKWHSHGRGISMEVLRRDLNLRVTDFGADPGLREVVRRYFQLVRDYMTRVGLPSFVHARNFA